MINQWINALSELDPMQALVLLGSALLVFFASKRIIHQGFTLFLWLIISMVGTVGIVYSLNPPLFNQIKTQLEKTNFSFDVAKKHF